MTKKVKKIYKSVLKMKKLQTLVLILAPSYFIGRLLIGLIFNV